MKAIKRRMGPTKLKKTKSKKTKGYKKRSAYGTKRKR
tara:strand:+ start:822 stop:932 length:111 start_codon:yes stop_codon:yes gene_type:complete